MSHGVFLLLEVIGLISTTAVILSALWIARHYKRYTWPVYVTSGTMLATSVLFCAQRWIGGLEHVPYELLTNYVMVQLSFLFVSIILTRCGFSRDYIRSLCTPRKS
jgi:hypothetical protein